MNDRIIIIGSGIAALAAADILRKSKNVIIFTKSDKEDGNSRLAQGGIAAALDSGDSWEEHLHDTLAAACMHADSETAAMLVQNGPELIRKLMADGMNFDKNADGSVDYAREGAHGKRRIVHAGGDATGRRLVDHMWSRLAEDPHVVVHEQESAIELIMTDDGECAGVYTRNADGRLFAHEAEAVILATGGAGSLYSCTSNHPNATGDGIALAYRAGAKIVDMEFIQFHPTILHRNGESLGLVSEAVRGEGAVLTDESGATFMKDCHPLGDLAPRDVVARAIHDRQMAGHQVMLDISPVAKFTERFPTIAALCRENHLPVDGHLLPVMPGAHFLMGGIKANSCGETSVPGLYAIGECACTGVHGANRLASNSLLEGIVFGSMMAEWILHGEVVQDRSAPYIAPGKRPFRDTLHLPTKEEIRQKMLKEAGTVRDQSGLLSLLSWLDQFDFRHVNVLNCSLEEVEIVNMLTAATLIATSALERTESRGGHCRTDFPHTDPDWQGKRIIRHLAEWFPVEKASNEIGGVAQ